MSVRSLIWSVSILHWAPSSYNIHIWGFLACLWIDGWRRCLGSIFRSSEMDLFLLQTYLNIFRYHIKDFNDFLSCNDYCPRFWSNKKLGYFKKWFLCWERERVSEINREWERRPAIMSSGTVSTSLLNGGENNFMNFFLALNIWNSNRNSLLFRQF